jgi:branched-chain amino acid transport system permease protein
MELPDSVAANVRLLAYGLLLIIMMHVRPQGLAGKYRFE